MLEKQTVTDEKKNKKQQQQQHKTATTKNKLPSIGGIGIIKTFSEAFLSPR